MSPTTTATFAELSDLHAHAIRLRELASDDVPAHQSAALLLALSSMNTELGELIDDLLAFRAAAKEPPLAAHYSPASEPKGCGEADPLPRRRCL